MVHASFFIGKCFMESLLRLLRPASCSHQLSTCYIAWKRPQGARIPRSGADCVPFRQILDDCPHDKGDEHHDDDEYDADQKDRPKLPFVLFRFLMTFVTNGT